MDGNLDSLSLYVILLCLYIPSMPRGVAHSSFKISGKGYFLSKHVEISAVVVSNLEHFLLSKFLIQHVKCSALCQQA